MHEGSWGGGSTRGGDTQVPAPSLLLLLRQKNGRVVVWFLIDSVTDRGEPLHRVWCPDWSGDSFAILRCVGDWPDRVLACSTWQDAEPANTAPASMGREIDAAAPGW